MEKKRLALLGCGKLNHIVADALASVGPEKLEYHINSVPGMKGDDYIIEHRSGRSGREGGAEYLFQDSTDRRWSIGGSAAECGFTDRILTGG